MIKWRNMSMLIAMIMIRWRNKMCQPSWQPSLLTLLVCWLFASSSSFDFQVKLACWAFFFQGSPLAWSHLRSHWSHFSSLFGSDRSMGDIISSVTGHFSTSSDLAQMQKFFKDRDAGAGDPVLQQTIETVQVALMWIIILGWIIFDLPRSMFNFGKSMQNQLLPG